MNLWYHSAGGPITVAGPDAKRSTIFTRRDDCHAAVLFPVRSRRREAQGVLTSDAVCDSAPDLSQFMRILRKVRFSAACLSEFFQNNRILVFVARVVNPDGIHHRIRLLNSLQRIGEL